MKHNARPQQRAAMPRPVGRAGAFGLAATAMLLAPLAAKAHPHVTVSVKTVVVTDEKGAITALRHAWTFDEAFSSFSTMGLDKNKDGRLDREELADLAKVNVESLSEYGYFSDLKVGKEKAAFSPVADYHLAHDGKALTLHFTLPVEGKAPDVRAAKLEVYDPSYFVAFGFAPDKPVRVEGGPACSATIQAPRGEAMTSLSKLSEADFTAGRITAADWASPVTFACK